MATLCLLGEGSEDERQIVLTVFDAVKGRGREVARIETKPGLDYSWDLSPDGCHIAILFPVGENRIRIQSLEGGQPHDLIVNGWYGFSGGRTGRRTARASTLVLPLFVFGISEPIGGWIADQLIKLGWDETRTRKGIVTIAFLTGLLLIPASRVQTATAAITLVIGGSLVGLATGNLIVILQCCAPPDLVGVWTGWENFAGNVGGVVAPLATGFLIARTGSYAPGFALAAFVLLAGLLSYWLIVGRLEPYA